MPARFIAFALSFFAAAADEDAPAGMHGVAAVTAAVSSGDAARDVAVDAFFVDDEAVSVADYDRCVTAGGCAPATGKPSRGGKSRVDWVEADRACAFFGKRLPSESEFVGSLRTTVQLPAAKALEATPEALSKFPPPAAAAPAAPLPPARSSYPPLEP